MTNTNMVSVKMLKINQFKKKGRNFNDDLLIALNQTQNESIIKLKFVNAIISANWNKYQTLIIRTQFWPFICYLFSMLCFLVYVLQDNFFEIEELVFRFTYFPLLGLCMCFSVNLIRSEIIKWKESESCDYFGLWNVIDLTYIVLNLSIMFMTFFQQDKTLEA